MARGPYEDEPQRVRVALLSSGPTVEATLGVAAGLGVRKGENPAAICSFHDVLQTKYEVTYHLFIAGDHCTGGSCLAAMLWEGCPAVEGEQGHSKSVHGKLTTDVASTVQAEGRLRAG